MCLGLLATDIERCWDGLAEVSRGHSRLIRPSRRPEHGLRNRSLNFDGKGDADKEGWDARNHAGG